MLQSRIHVDRNTAVALPCDSDGQGNQLAGLCAKEIGLVSSLA